MFKRQVLAISAAALVAGVALGGPAFAADKSIIVQSTTSTQNSGLYEFLLPKFQEKSGIEVKVVAVGTGQAIKNAENCDGDVLLVHAKASEEKFVADGGGVKRTDLMYNDFIVVGPPSDPAGVAGSNDVIGSLKKIAEAKAPFASRGDDSGTNKKELALWKEAGVDPKAGGDWYRDDVDSFSSSQPVVRSSTFCTLVVACSGSRGRSIRRTNMALPPAMKVGTPNTACSCTEASCSLRTTSSGPPPH